MALQLAWLGVYIPVELTSILVYGIYTAAGVAWTGATLGKWLCGVRILSRKGEQPDIVRSSIRALFVAISQCLLGLPLLLIGVECSKWGLHDHLAGTQARLDPACWIRRKRTMWVVYLFILSIGFIKAFGGISLYLIHRAWIRDAEKVIAERDANVTSSQTQQQVQEMSTVDGSPFAALRDEATFTDHLLLGGGMRDLAQAYLVLVPMAALQPCPWWTGFLAMEMFGRNRSLYEMLCQRRLRDLKDADEGRGEGIQRL